MSRNESVIRCTMKRVKRHEILKRLADVVCYLAKQELQFCGYYESRTSVNRGDYIQLLTYKVKLLSYMDPLLATILEKSQFPEVRFQ